MNCSKVEELIGLYISGELAKGEREAVREHLDRCEACRALLEEEQHLSKLLRELPVEACPDDVVRRVWKETVGKSASLWERLAGFPLTRKEVGYRVVPVAIAVAAVLIVMLVLPRPMVQEKPAQTYSAEQIDAAKKETEFAISLLLQVADRSQESLSKRQVLQLVTRPIEKSFKKSFNISEGGKES